METPISKQIENLQRVRGMIGFERPLDQSINDTLNLLKWAKIKLEEAPEPLADLDKILLDLLIQVREVDAIPVEEMERKIESAIKAVMDYKPENAIFWTEQDFESQARTIEIIYLTETEQGHLRHLAEDLEKNPTKPVPREHRIYDRSEFKKAVSEMIRKHDPIEGITWNTVGHYLSEYCRYEKV